MSADSPTTTVVNAVTEPRVFAFLNDEIEAAPYREEGQRGIDRALPGTEDLTGRVKVYVSGGENKMHSHPKEDHVFYVLRGQATFHIEHDDNAVDVSANNAILLPRGTRYWFTNTGTGNLVLLRVGSGRFASYRLDAEGNEIPSGNSRWKVDAGTAING